MYVLLQAINVSTNRRSRFAGWSFRDDHPFDGTRHVMAQNMRSRRRQVVVLSNALIRPTCSVLDHTHRPTGLPIIASVLQAAIQKFP